MLLKKEALGRLQDIAHNIGAVGETSNIWDLHQQYQTNGCLESLIKRLAESAFGLQQVQFIHSEWDQDEVDYRGQCKVFFKAVIPMFEQGKPVYVVFDGSYHDDFYEDNYILPESIYTLDEWEILRTQAIELMQRDQYVARYISQPSIN